MSTSMKTLKVYYKGVCQELSVADGTTEDEIFQIMKRIFRIKEDISQFFFQDSEGRVLILPKKLPSELSVFLLVRSDENYISSSPSESNKELKWKFICTKGTENQLVGGTHYFPINSPNKSLHPSIISSINFSKGKHYTVIKVDSHGCGWVGFGQPGSPPEYFNPGWHCASEYLYIPKEKYPTFIQIGESACDNVTKLTGIAIDYDTRTGYFLQVDSDSEFKPMSIIAKVTELPQSILIFAGIKGWDCIPPPHTGITLIKDSLPFPKLNNLRVQRTISWDKDKIHCV